MSKEAPPLRRLTANIHAKSPAPAPPFLVCRNGAGDVSREIIISSVKDLRYFSNADSLTAEGKAIEDYFPSSAREVSAATDSSITSGRPLPSAFCQRLLSGKKTAKTEQSTGHQTTVNRPPCGPQVNPAPGLNLRYRYAESAELSKCRQLEESWLRLLSEARSLTANGSSASSSKKIASKPGFIEFKPRASPSKPASHPSQSNVAEQTPTPTSGKGAIGDQPRNGAKRRSLSLQATVKIAYSAKEALSMCSFLNKNSTSNAHSASDPSVYEAELMSSITMAKRKLAIRPAPPQPPCTNRTEYGLLNDISRQKARTRGSPDGNDALDTSSEYAISLNSDLQKRAQAELEEETPTRHLAFTEAKPQTRAMNPALALQGDCVDETRGDFLTELASPQSKSSVLEEDPPCEVMSIVPKPPLPLPNPIESSCSVKRAINPRATTSNDKQSLKQLIYPTIAQNSVVEPTASDFTARTRQAKNVASKENSLPHKAASPPKPSPTRESSSAKKRIGMSPSIKSSKTATASPSNWRLQSSDAYDRPFTIDTSPSEYQCLQASNDSVKSFLSFRSGMASHPLPTSHLATRLQTPNSKSTHN